MLPVALGNCVCVCVCVELIKFISFVVAFVVFLWNEPSLSVATILVKWAVKRVKQVRVFH